MNGKFYYHEIIKRTSAAFGTLFNNIYIRHLNSNSAGYNQGSPLNLNKDLYVKQANSSSLPIPVDYADYALDVKLKVGDDLQIKSKIEDAAQNIHSYIKVPISYGPIQKFLARIEQKPDPRNRVAITLPRMSFEVGQLAYDASRKSSSLQTFNTIVGSNNTPRQLYLPVPYNLPFQLSIATKYNDDMFQIVEQILPMFRPEFNLTVNLSSIIGEKRDIPLILQGISPFQDEYEGDFNSRRFITATLNFVAKIFFFGPVDTDENGNIIKKVTVDYYTDTNRINASRVRRYVVTPRATQDYNNDEITTLSQNISTNVTKFNVSDGTLLTENSYIQVNNENMFIKSIDGNSITVLRGQDQTIIQEHQVGDVINVIDVSDDELIQPGDEFDFNEETFDFGDGLIYSPRKGVDV